MGRVYPQPLTSASPGNKSTTRGAVESQRISIPASALYALLVTFQMRLLFALEVFVGQAQRKFGEDGVGRGWATFG